MNKALQILADGGMLGSDNFGQLYANQAEEEKEYLKDKKTSVFTRIGAGIGAVGAGIGGVLASPFTGGASIAAAVPIVTKLGEHAINGKPERGQDNDPLADLGLSALEGGLQGLAAYAGAGGFGNVGGSDYDVSQLTSKEIPNSGFTGDATFYAKCGGKMYANGGSTSFTTTQQTNGLIVLNGKTHEGGGIDLMDGIEVEGGETIYNDFVFTNSHTITFPIAQKYNLPQGSIGKTFAAASKHYSKYVDERPDDPYAKESFAEHMSRLEAAHLEAVPQSRPENIGVQNVNASILGEGAPARNGGKIMWYVNSVPFKSGGKIMYEEGGPEIPSPPQPSTTQQQGAKLIELGNNLPYKPTFKGTDPTWQTWDNLVSTITEYELGAKGPEGSAINRSSFEDLSGVHFDNEMDCSGGCTTVQNAMRKAKNLPPININRNNSTSVYNSGTKVTENDAVHGSWAYFTKPGEISHIGQVLIDDNGKKFIAEVAAPEKFTGAAITPYEDRMKELTDAGFTSAFSTDYELYDKPEPKPAPVAKKGSGVKSMQQSTMPLTFKDGGSITYADGGDLNEGWTADSVQRVINHWTIDQGRQQSTIDPQMLLDLSQEYNIPIEVVLAQGAAEGFFGIAERPRRSNNPFNVGNTDGGDNISYEEGVRLGFTHVYRTLEEGIRAYFDLLSTDYVPESGDWNEVFENGFVNRAGNRYASNPTYEETLRGMIDTIAEIGGVNATLTTSQASAPSTDGTGNTGNTSGTGYTPPRSNMDIPSTLDTIIENANNNANNYIPAFGEAPKASQSQYDTGKENVNPVDSIPRSMTKAEFNNWAKVEYPRWDKLSDENRSELYDDYFSKMDLVKIGGKVYPKVHPVTGGTLRDIQGGTYEPDDVVTDWNGYVVEGGTPYGTYSMNGETVIVENPNYSTKSNINRPMQSRTSQPSATATPVNDPFQPIIESSITLEDFTEDEELVPIPSASPPPNVVTFDPRSLYPLANNGKLTVPEMTGNLAGTGGKPATDKTKVNAMSYMKYAPIAADLANLGLLYANKPDQVNAEDFYINDDYRKQNIDKELLQREIDLQTADLTQSLTQGATTQSGFMGALAAISAGTSKAKTDAVMKGQLFDAEQGQMFEQFEFQKNTANSQIGLQVQNMNDANEAAYLGAQMDAISGLSNNLGTLGKEWQDLNTVRSTTGIDPITGNIVNKTVFDAYARAQANSKDTQTIDQRSNGRK